MSEIEATISRISSYEGVDRILIIKSIETEESCNSIIMRSMAKGVNPNEVKSDKEKLKEELFAKNIPQIGREAKSMIKQLDPKNDLTFLRIRTKGHEILIAPDKEFFLCVLQNMSSK
jgi:dynein light chain roadblock-type